VQDDPDEEYSAPSSYAQVFKHWDKKNSLGWKRLEEILSHGRIHGIGGDIYLISTSKDPSDCTGADALTVGILFGAKTKELYFYGTPSCH